ncbi:hypothetical protein ENUP19_0053G0028 [Entamoeba nuttalli]|uniref:Leucine rich repeat protein, BspA family protein n=1 Tax=Entamoeba nuttalli TaxID=412467 RepID=A0ABQ0DC42_9EUKA
MQLGYNEIIIVSKYFEDIKDFINLEIGVKRFQGNMERFHFNPIPLNQSSRKLFPNIETFHIYNKEDEIFKDGRIFKYVIWYKVKVNSLEDFCFYGCNDIQSIEIPTSVSKIGDYCFICCSSLTSINIPTSVIEIGYGCFNECISLTSINIPSSITSFGKGCFYHCRCEEKLKKNKKIPKYCF